MRLFQRVFSEEARFVPHCWEILFEEIPQRVIFMVGIPGLEGMKSSDLKICDPCSSFSNKIKNNNPNMCYTRTCTYPNDMRPSRLFLLLGSNLFWASLKQRLWVNDLFAMNGNSFVSANADKMKIPGNLPESMKRHVLSGIKSLICTIVRAETISNWPLRHRPSIRKEFLIRAIWK